MATAAANERPTFISEAHLDYLDELFESYSLEMSRATPLLRTAFRLSEPEAKAAVTFWEKSFGKRVTT